MDNLNRICLIKDSRREFVEPVNGKQGIFEKRRESGSQLAKGREGMVVADGIASALPDMFLGIEVRTSRRKTNHLYPDFGVEYVVERGTTMPRGTVPEKQNGTVRQALQHVLHEMGSGGCRLFR